MKTSLLLILALISFCTFAQSPPKASQGVINLMTWDFEKNGPAKLDGNWGFYWQKLLSPATIGKTNTRQYTEIVSIWNGKFTPSTRLSGQGYATYHLTVLLPQTTDLLALELPDIYTNYILWIDGTRKASNGKVGRNRKESVPQWLPQTVIFQPTNDTVDLVLQVSNFHHKRGGLNDHIYIGLHKQLLQKRESSVVTNIILTGGLGLIGCFFIILFFFFKKDRAALYFAAICITWSIRSVFTNLYLFIKLFPNFDWELGVKIEYLTLYLTMMWTVLFVSKMYPHDTIKWVRYTLITVNSVFIFLTIATPAMVFTQLITVYLFFAWTLLAYVAYVVVHALIFDRAGAWFTAASIILGVLMFSYDMLTYREVFDFNPLIFSVGYMAIFFLNATALAYQLSLENPRGAEEKLSFDEMKMRDVLV